MPSIRSALAVKAFLEMAEGLETGSFGPRPRIALTGMGAQPVRPCLTGKEARSAFCSSPRLTARAAIIL